MRETQIWPGWDTVRDIGSGGYGKVYEIRKTDNTGSYSSALKVISIPRSADEYREYADNGYDDISITAIFKSQVDDIVSEFKMMSQFKGTSNIVSYEDHMIVPHKDGQGWDILIRMELLTPLPEYINQHGLTEGQVIQLGSDICRALELCGQRGIIHRDIKPQNIFVNEFGDFKLGDFGIARSMDHTTKATKTGTYSYMAPEVYSDKPYGASVDIYSLGLVLYWTLNERRLPFLPLPPAVPTAAQNIEAQMKRLNGDTIPAPLHGSESLKNAVLMACSFYSADRFFNPEAFRQALSAGAQATNQVVLFPKSKTEPQVSSGPSRDATDYTTGSWSIKFEPPSSSEKQPQGESTKGAWDDSTSVHWTPGTDSEHTSDQKSAEHTETNRSEPFVDSFNDNMETAQVAKPQTAKRVFKIVAIVIAVCVVAQLISHLASGRMSAGHGTQRRIEYTVGTVDGRTYVNEWANLKFVIPEGWRISDIDNIDNIDDSDDIDTDVLEFMELLEAFDGTGLRISGENAQGHILSCRVHFRALVGESIPLTEEEYLDQEMDRYDEMYNNIQYDRQYEKIQLGDTFTSVHVYKFYDNETYVESIYCRKLGKRMCVIEVDGYSQEENDRLVSGFTRYDEYERVYGDSTNN